MNKKTQGTIGFLFIYDIDGLEWSNFLSGVLEKEPYNIKSFCCPLKKLDQDLMEICSVRVLLFTPRIEDHASSLDLDLLQPDSKQNCLLEINGLLSETELPAWNAVYTLTETVESQREVFAGLVDLYERITGNVEDIDVNDTDDNNLFILDLVPSVLYPGQREVFVIFNYEETGEVCVAVEGVKDRLSTRKYTKSIRLFELPDTCNGHLSVNIFLNQQTDPMFSTNILILKSENLTESLIVNLRRILCPPPGTPEQTTATALEPISCVDPFSSPHCSEETLKKCWETLKDVFATVKDSEACFEKLEKPKETKIEKETEQTSEMHTVTLRKKSFMKKFKDFFQNSLPRNQNIYKVAIKNRKSRRVLMAKCQKLKKIPRFPEKQK